MLLETTMLKLILWSKLLQRIPDWDLHWLLSSYIILRTSGLSQFKLSIYRRFLHYLIFKKHLNETYSTAFISKIEENSLFLFLKVKVNLIKKKFLALVFRNPKIAGAFTIFESYIRNSYKCDLTDTWLIRKISLRPS